MIQFDDDWFRPWLAEHPVPPGVPVISRSWAETVTEGQESLNTEDRTGL
jgi:hypothetical protein